MTNRLVCVAVAIPAPAGESIDVARQAYEPKVGRLPAHVTVLPPMRLDDEAVEVLVEHLVAVASRTRPFDARLAGTDTFRPRSPVVFVEIADGIPELRHLEQEVRSGSGAARSRFPYRPHVTIAHRVDDDVLDEASAALAEFHAVVRVESLSLFEHHDRRWELLRDFPLRG